MKDVAILLATYNGQKYLKEQLDSILAQTFQDFRLVIHDDGSTDDTLKIINEYRDHYPDKIEIIYGHPSGSAKANFMYLLSEIEADYYFLSDQDDVWLPDKMEKSLKELLAIQASKSSNKIPCIVFTDMYVADDRLEVIDNSFIRYIGRDINNTKYTQIIIDNPASGTTLCFNRALRDIAISGKGVDWNNVPMHDAWLLEIGAIFGCVQGIDRPFVKYRQTGQNIMGANTESNVQKIARNVDDVSKGFLKKKKTFINESRLFARELLKLENMPQEKRSVLEAFANISTKNKLARIKFYKENDFTRAHNNMWMRLWL